MAAHRGNGEGSIYQRSSDGRWMAAIFLGYSPEGKQIRKVVSARTRAEAAEKLRALQRQADDGLPPVDSRLTVGQLLERWHDDVLRHQVSWSAAKNYKSVADHHLVPVLGRKKVAALTTADVDRLLSQKMDSGFSVSTVRRIRSVLAQALDQGIRWGVVARNVATLSRPPKQARQEGRSLTPDQADALLQALKGHRNEALYTLMLTTGLRRGEALGLKWSDFDEPKGVIRVKRQLTREDGALFTKDTKTSRSRRAINLPRPMVDLLKRHRASQNEDRLRLGRAWVNSGHVFTSSVGTPIDPRNLYRDFQKVCDAAGIGRWHPHELRHSAASLMLAQGVPLQVVSQVLGHSTIRLTADVYGHILEPDRQAAADAMGSLLWGTK